jgi:hypothetical protein
MQTDILEERIASIFRVENQTSKKAATAQPPAACCFLVRPIFDHEDGGHMLL